MANSNLSAQSASIEPVSAHQSPLRILWLKTELLHPVDKGGKIRTYEMLKRLKPLHHIAYMTLDDGTTGSEEREKALEYCHELVCVPFALTRRASLRFYAEVALNVGSNLPYAISRYRSTELSNLISSHVASGRYDIVIADFLLQAVNIPKNLPVPTVLFQHNVEAMIWRRHAENQMNVVAKHYFRSQWRRMIDFEAEACRGFDSVVAVSEDDRRTMEQDYNISSVAAVPTGVDTEYFHPSGEAPMPHSLVFTGSMDWMPNQDAIRFFLGEIWPRVRNALPDATFTIVGRNPSPSLIEEAGRHPGVTVTGRVDDVRPYMQDAACFVVPIRIGGGTRLKIFEAMAMGMPVVSTTIGAEGLGVKDCKDLVLQDCPTAFAQALIDVLTNEELADRLGRQAAATVQTHFSWDRATACFSELLYAACDRAKTRLEKLER